MALTTLAIRNAKPAVKRYKLADERSLFLLVMPNGAKYWRLSYRFLGKQLADSAVDASIAEVSKSAILGADAPMLEAIERRMARGDSMDLRPVIFAAMPHRMPEIESAGKRRASRGSTPSRKFADFAPASSPGHCFPYYL